MMRTRERALGAAVELLGTQGIRALTHGRTDAAAGLPKGSTSNHFRTRADLIHAVVDHIVASEQRVFAAGGPPQNLDEFVTSLRAFIREATGPQRTLTVARLACFVEAVHDAQIRAALADGRRAIEGATAGALEALGLPRPFSAARRLLAHVDGMILHQLTFKQMTEEDVASALQAGLG